MAKLLHVIALLFCSATLLAAYQIDKFREMSPELQASFVRFLQQYQPFVIDRSWAPILSTPGYLHWPGGERNVFIGADMHNQPQLRPFKERTTWEKFYMDDETMLFLQRIEKGLQSIKTDNEHERWFRIELAQTLHPLNRPQYPMPRIIRGVVDRLLSRTGETDPRIIQETHATIRQIVDNRYQLGSYDSPPPPSPQARALARAFLF